VRDYKNQDVPPASFALRDAAAVKRYLIEAFGFEESNVISLEDPTKGELEAVFGTSSDPHGRLFRAVERLAPEKPSVFVYYSGHGAPSMKDSHAYLVPADANPNYVELNGYQRDVLLSNLAALPAGPVTVVLEACFSGSFDQGAFIRDASPLVTVARSAVPSGVDLFSSSSASEISSWYREKEHSLFTYYLLSALRENLARGSSPTFDELVREVGAKVSLAAERLNREQSPEFVGRRDRIAFSF